MDASFLDEIVLGSLTPIEVPVRIEGEKDKFILKEASAGAGQDYHNYILRCAKVRPGNIGAAGNIQIESINGLASVESMLVSRCLFRRTPTGDVPVAEADVLQWPGPLVPILYARIKQISPWLDKGEDEGPKNLQSNGKAP